MSLYAENIDVCLGLSVNEPSCFHVRVSKDPELKFSFSTLAWQKQKGVNYIL